MRLTRAIGLALLLLGCVVLAQETPYDESLKLSLESFDKITMILARIENEESAKEAKEELKKEVEVWVKIRKQSEKLPPPTPEEKERIAKENRPKLEMATKKFLGEIERLRRVSGAKETLQELRPILDYKPK